MIETASGVGIYSDTVLTFNGLEHIYKSVDKLVVGDVICISRKHTFPEDNIKLDFVHNKPKMATNTKEVTIPNRFSADLAEWLGYLIANGSVSENFIKMSSNSELLRDNFNKLTRKIFNVDGVTIKCEGKCTDITIFSVVIKKFLDYLSGGWVTARFKKVPEGVVRGTLESQRKFIKSLFDCDGSYNRGELEYSTASESLARGIQQILFKFGIVSFIKRDYAKEYPDHTYWKLYVRGAECDKMFETVLIDSIKYTEHIVKKRNTNIDVIYGLQEHLREAIKMSRRQLGSNGAGVYVDNKGARVRFVLSKNLSTMNCKNISYEMLQKVYKDFTNAPDEQKKSVVNIAETIREILNNKYFYDLVVDLNGKTTLETFESNSVFLENSVKVLEAS